jgi:serine/threonine protein kinase
LDGFEDAPYTFEKGIRTLSHSLDQDDESLGIQLEQHLEALRSGRPGTEASTSNEFAGLQPIVERLHDLSRCLAHCSTVDIPPIAVSTVNFPRPTGCTPAEGHGEPIHIGKFQIIGPLGKGGQAATLLAFDPDLHRRVVLKLYHQARTASEQDQVLREGQALARVRSPYVAQCYSAERHGDCPFLVVEYIRGQNLAELQRHRPMSLAQALEIVSQLAEGLAAVHACGLLHRDIKPGNILIGDDGKPRLVDFGLATTLASDDLAKISGTPAYMAPEQARGDAERIDARTDLFGLGAVLYELVTGRPPYQAPDKLAVLKLAQAGRVLPPVQIQPTIPRALNQMCLRCLAADPANRYASAAQLQEAIRQLRTPPRPRWTLVAALASFITVVALAVLWFNRPGDLPQDATAPKDKRLSPKDPASPDAKGISAPSPMPAYLKGRKLRAEFDLGLHLLGSTLSPEDQRHLLKVGDYISFQIKPAQDCYLGIWNVTADKVIALFPNDIDTDNRLLAGQTRVLLGSRPKVKAAKASGLEYLHVLASSRPLRDIDAPSLRAGGFQVFNTPQASERFRTALRELELVDQGDAVSELIVSMEVRP